MAPAIDDWLAKIARHIFRSVPFHLVLIGMEAAGDVCASDLRRGAPPDPGYGYLISRGNDLEYRPATTA